MPRTGRPKNEDRDAVTSFQLHVRMTAAEWRKLEQLTADANKALKVFGFPASLTKAMVIRKLVTDARSVVPAPAEMGRTLRALGGQGQGESEAAPEHVATKPVRKARRP